MHTNEFYNGKWDDPATPRGMPNAGGKMRGTAKMRHTSGHSNKVCPGTGPGLSQTKHNAPGMMPYDASKMKNNKMPADNGNWNDGTGKKRP